jgi:hypothetical protein
MEKVTGGRKKYREVMVLLIIWVLERIFPLGLRINRIRYFILNFIYIEYFLFSYMSVEYGRIHVLNIKQFTYRFALLNVISLKL